MTALPHAFAPQATPMKGVSTAKDLQSTEPQNTAEHDQSFNDLIEQRRDHSASSDDPVIQQRDHRDVELSDKLAAGKSLRDPIAEPVPDSDSNILELTLADIDGGTHPEIDLPGVADVSDMPTPATDMIDIAEASLSTENDASKVEPIILTDDMIVAETEVTDGTETPAIPDDIATLFANDDDQDIRIPDEPPVTATANDTLEPDLRLPAGTDTGLQDISGLNAVDRTIVPGLSEPIPDTDPVIAATSILGRGESGSALSSPAAAAATTPKPTALPPQTPSTSPLEVQDQLQGQAETQAATPEAEMQDIELPRAERFAPPTTAEQAASTAERSITIKTPMNASDVMRAIDVPTLATATDTATLPKTTPNISVAPIITPMTGMSERFATTLLQSSPQPQAPVTLDKIPQAVVTVALTSRSATLQIDPPELGRIQLDYQFDSQGRTVITLVPESDAARTALAERMASITAALEQNANGEVDVQLGSSQDFTADQGQFTSDGSDSPASGSDGLSRSETDVEQAANIRAIAELERFARSVANGGNDRLHILV